VQGRVLEEGLCDGAAQAPAPRTEELTPVTPVLSTHPTGVTRELVGPSRYVTGTLGGAAVLPPVSS
jgi:hypothetical protein